MTEIDQLSAWTSLSACSSSALRRGTAEAREEEAEEGEGEAREELLELGLELPGALSSWRRRAYCDCGR